jgi:hypothetical protein
VRVSELKALPEDPIKSIPAFMSLSALPHDLKPKKISTRKMSNMVMADNKKPRMRLLSEQVDQPN